MKPISVKLDMWSTIWMTSWDQLTNHVENGVRDQVWGMVGYQGQIHVISQDLTLFFKGLPLD